MRLRWLPLLPLLLAAASPAGAEEPADATPVDPLADLTPITDAETLRRHYSGVTMFGYGTLHGTKWSEFYCENGSLIYIHGTDPVSGSWAVRAPHVCFTYHLPDAEWVKEQYRGTEQTTCVEVYRHDDGSFRHREVSTEMRGPTSVVLGRLAGDAFKMQRLGGMSCSDLSS